MKTKKELLTKIKKKKRTFQLKPSPISRSWHLAARIKKYQKHKEKRK